MFVIPESQKGTDIRREWELDDLCDTTRPLFPHLLFQGVRFVAGRLRHVSRLDWCLLTGGVETVAIVPVPTSVLIASVGLVSHSNQITAD